LGQIEQIHQNHFLVGDFQYDDQENEEVCQEKVYQEEVCQGVACQVQYHLYSKHQGILEATNWWEIYPTYLQEITPKQKSLPPDGSYTKESTYLIH
jgi:hypothetical protein